MFFNRPQNQPESNGLFRISRCHIEVSLPFIRAIFLKIQEFLKIQDLRQL